MTHVKGFKKYKKLVDNKLRKIHIDLIDKIKEELNNEGKELKVWIGGPGRNAPYFSKRQLIRELLESYGFVTYYSEDRPLEFVDLHTKEMLEWFTDCYLIVILAASCSASAESMEVGHDDVLRAKVFIIAHDRYRNGWIARGPWEKFYRGGIFYFSSYQFDDVIDKLFKWIFGEIVKDERTIRVLRESFRRY